MPDLTDQLLPRIKDHRIPELDLPAEFVQPHYQDSQSSIRRTASAL